MLSIDGAGYRDRAESYEVKPPLDHHRSTVELAAEGLLLAVDVIGEDLPPID